MTDKRWPHWATLTRRALEYWERYDGRDVWGAEADNAWIRADCEDEARSAPVEDGGRGMVSAFGPEGIDRALTWEDVHAN